MYTSVIHVLVPARAAGLVRPERHEPVSVGVPDERWRLSCSFRKAVTRLDEVNV